MATWHYADATKQQFQIDESQLAAAVQQGKIMSSTPVWTAGMANWQMAGQALPQLFQSTPPVMAGASGPPPMGGAAFPIKSHEVDYEIFGDDMQIVEVELDPGETVIAEAGAMNYVEQEIHFEAKMGDGSQPNEGIMGKLLAVGKRALTGESIFMTHFTHRGGEGKRRVAFAAPYPGKIMAINLAQIG
ncbi:MAG: AIM24 family protein, partial [Verrucomicrobiae bacterium]|nr:AIM24 family protein [Verrucomicrobiae bacterium]